MKKLMTMMLGLSLLVGTSYVFAQGTTDTTKSTKKGKKGKKGKKDTTSTTTNSK